MEVLLQDEFILRYDDLSESHSKLRKSSFLDSEIAKEQPQGNAKPLKKLTHEKRNQSESLLLIKRMASHASKIQILQNDESQSKESPGNQAGFMKKVTLHSLSADKDPTFDVNRGLIANVQPKTKIVPTSKIAKDVNTTPPESERVTFDPVKAARLEEEQRKIMEELMGGLKKQATTSEQLMIESPVINKQNMFMSYVSHDESDRYSLKKHEESLEKVDLDDLEEQQRKLMAEMMADMSQQKTVSNSPNKPKLVEEKEDDKEVVIEDLEEQQRKLMEEMMAGMGIAPDIRPLEPQRIVSSLSDSKESLGNNIEDLEEKQRKLMEELMMDIPQPVPVSKKNVSEDQSINPKLFIKDQLVNEASVDLNLEEDKKPWHKTSVPNLPLSLKAPSKGEIILQSRRSSAHQNNDVFSQDKSSNKNAFKNQKGDIHDDGLSEDSSEIDQNPHQLIHKPLATKSQSNIKRNSAHALNAPEKSPGQDPGKLSNLGHQHMKSINAQSAAIKQLEDELLIPSPADSKVNLKVISRTVSEVIDDDQMRQLRLEEPVPHPKRDLYANTDHKMPAKEQYGVYVSEIDTNGQVKKKAPIVKRKLPGTATKDSPPPGKANLLPGFGSTGDFSPLPDFTTGLTPLNRGLIKLKKPKKDYSGELYSSKDSSDNGDALNSPKDT